MTVIDAGANIGQYSLLASTAVGNAGQVHSFEPVPRNFEQLTKNVNRNALQNVRTNRMALWHRREQLNFGQNDGVSGNSGSFSLQRNGFAVQAISLDEYAECLPQVHLIKLDVEGSEPFVIQGGLNTISRFRPIILMEINRSALVAAGSSTESLWDLLQSLGYSMLKVAFNPKDRRILSSFSGVEQINILAYSGNVGLESFKSWSISDVLRWSRSRW